jgi:hypothetical protein
VDGRISGLAEAGATQSPRIAIPVRLPGLNFVGRSKMSSFYLKIPARPTTEPGEQEGIPKYVRERTDKNDKTVYKYSYSWPENFDFMSVS